MSGLNSLISRWIRSRSRISAMRPSISTSVFRAASDSTTAYSAGSEFSITSNRAAPNVATRSQISEPIDPLAGTQQQILDGNRSQTRGIAALERREAPDDQPVATRLHQNGFRPRVM